jgi:predicted DNA-binding protein (MmcQ/YjbR family)
MSENRTRRYLREIRQSYHLAVQDWVDFRIEGMIKHLEEAVTETQELIIFLKTPRKVQDV